MNNQPNLLNPTPQPIEGHLSSARKWILVFGVVIIVILLAFYIYAIYLSRLNYNKVAEEAQKAKQQEESHRQTYVDNTFGFSIDLPESWKGYRINHIKEDIYDLTGRTTTNNRVVDSIQLIEIHHPLESAENPREVMPIMIFTHAQWEHVFNQEWSVGAAPIPPSLLGDNSQWVMALPARYNYDYKPGWEEVDQLVHTIKVFELGTNSQETSTNNQNFDTSTWKIYTKEKETYGIRYEVSYPPNWTPSIDEFYFSIKNEADSIFTIETPPLGFGIDTTINEEDIIVDGRQAIRINFKGGNNRDRILVQFKEKSLENIQIQFNTQEGSSTEIFDQILSTFRFTR